MPVRITPLKSGMYRVRKDGDITAKRTTKAKAEAQARLLRAFDRKLNR